MKIKNKCILLVVLLIVFSLFSFTNVFADSNEMFVMTLNCDKSITEQLKSDKYNVDNFGPGDTRNISFSIKSEGSMAMYVSDELEVVIHTNTKDVLKNIKSIKDCPIMIKSQNYVLNNEKSNINNGVITLVYNRDKEILSGSGNKAEIIEEYSSSTSHMFNLYFDVDGGNEWQDSDIIISTTVYAEQYDCECDNTDTNINKENNNELIHNDGRAKTGDTFDIIKDVIMLIVSGVVFIALIIVCIKDKHKNEENKRKMNKNEENKRK